eukprot:251308-Prorocentrum_minimum.AAC.3
MSTFQIRKAHSLSEKHIRDLKQLGAVRQERERGVVAHGAQRVARLRHHGAEEELHRLHRVAKRAHGGEHAQQPLALRRLAGHGGDGDGARLLHDVRELHLRTAKRAVDFSQKFASCRSEVPWRRGLRRRLSAVGASRNRAAAKRSLFTGKTRQPSARSSLDTLEKVSVGCCWMGGWVGHLLLLEPLAIGPQAGDLRLHLGVRLHRPVLEVHEENIPGAQAALGDHVLGRDVHHAHLAGHHHLALLGDVVAPGAEAVAVERGADAVTVGEGEQRRAVPGLEQRGGEFVKGAALLVHVDVVLPRLGNHHHHRLGEGAAVADEELEDGVKGAGVRGGLIHDGEEAGEVLLVEPEPGALHQALARLHPVLVAAEGVDLAVVA